MGGRCRGFSLALTATLDTEVANVQSLALGITDVLDLLGSKYEGGNLDRGPVSTVGLAWGVVSRHGIVRRRGARTGDLIVVTGGLGLGWLEYQLRTNGLNNLVNPADQEVFLRYKEMPMGAAGPIAAVAENSWFTSGMDLSDGLVEFLYTIAQRSHLGCVIDYMALPVSDVTKRNIPLLSKIDQRMASVLHDWPSLIALEPGYDSPLRHAFTISPSAVDNAQNIFAEHGANLHVIGEVISDPSVLLLRENSSTIIPKFWDDQLRERSTLNVWIDFLEAFS